MFEGGDAVDQSAKAGKSKSKKKKNRKTKKNRKQECNGVSETPGERTATEQTADRILRGWQAATEYAPGAQQEAVRREMSAMKSEDDLAARVEALRREEAAQAALRREQSAMQLEDDLATRVRREEARKRKKALKKAIREEKRKKQYLVDAIVTLEPGFELTPDATVEKLDDYFLKLKRRQEIALDDRLDSASPSSDGNSALIAPIPQRPHSRLSIGSGRGAGSPLQDPFEPPSPRVLTREEKMFFDEHALAEYADVNGDVKVQITADSDGRPDDIPTEVGPLISESGQSTETFDPRSGESNSGYSVCSREATPTTEDAKTVNVREEPVMSYQPVSLQFVSIWDPVQPGSGPAIETLYNGEHHKVSYISAHRPDLLQQLQVGDIIMEVSTWDPATQSSGVTCSEAQYHHLPFGAGVGFTPYRSERVLFNTPSFGTPAYWDARYHITVLREVWVDPHA